MQSVPLAALFVLLSIAIVMLPDTTQKQAGALRPALIGTVVAHVTCTRNHVTHLEVKMSKIEVTKPPTAVAEVCYVQ